MRRLTGRSRAQSTGWAARGERLLGRTSPLGALVEGRRGRRAARASRTSTSSTPGCRRSSRRSPRPSSPRRLGVPWVADLGDPWALDEMMVYPTALHRRRELRRMRRRSASAAAIVMSTPEAAQRRARRRSPSSRDRRSSRSPTATTPPTSQAPCAAAGATASSGSCTRATSTPSSGCSSDGARGCGGSSADGRAASTSSRARTSTCSRRSTGCSPATRARGTLEVHLAGVLSEADREIAEPLASCSCTATCRTPSRSSSCAAPTCSSCRCRSSPPAARAGIVPGKTYEYLASGTADPRRRPRGRRPRPARARPAERSSALRPVSTAWPRRSGASSRFGARGGDPPRPRPDVVERYEYRALARRLGEVFDRAAG